ncbi:MAG: phenylalanine--tRNA ligase subunit beta, partial [Candidatus Zixiibacteriota bacterium]
MKVSYNWIRELVDVEWAPEEMAHRLTLAGTACESIVPLSERFEHMVVGEILEVKAIPGADRIRLAQVDIGSDKLSIICGAPNLETGQKAAVAKLGAALPGGLKVEALSKFGVESRGMLLSEAELELSEDHRGIMVIPGEFKPGDPLAQALQLDDYSLEFELTPNRPDSMSAIGIARDVAALSGKRIRRPEWSLSESGGKTADNIQVEIEDPDFCPRYAARIVKNVVIKQAPQWMRARLLASGVTPINNVVDVTNYVLLETGQPLHAFDLSHFSTGKVVVKRASGKQKYTTLDGIEREVDESVLMITNGPEYLAAGGVMGGLKSSITETTTDVLLESAYFEPSSIRKSRKKLGLSTDASARFERGVDPNGTALAINRAAQLLSETADGSVCDGVVDSYVKKIAPRKINLRPERVNQILGTQIQTPEIVDILRGLEFEVQNGDILNVTAPTFRPD